MDGQSNGIAACFHAREIVDHLASWGFGECREDVCENLLEPEG